MVIIRSPSSFFASSFFSQRCVNCEISCRSIIFFRFIFLRSWLYSYRNGFGLHVIFKHYCIDFFRHISLSGKTPSTISCSVFLVTALFENSTLFCTSMAINTKYTRLQRIQLHLTNYMYIKIFSIDGFNCQ